MPSDSISLDEDAKLALARAFDAAWDRFIAREGAAADTDDNRKRLAQRLVALAKSGEHDERQLADNALIYLCVFAVATRLGAGTDDDGEAPQGSTMKEAFGQSAHAFAPDAIAAMSTALDRCLEELPLRLPSDVMTFLTTTIMDEAARGQRDPEQLRNHALEALRTR